MRGATQRAGLREGLFPGSRARKKALTIPRGGGGLVAGPRYSAAWIYDSARALSVSGVPAVEYIRRDGSTSDSSWTAVGSYDFVGDSYVDLSDADIGVDHLVLSPDYLWLATWWLSDFNRVSSTVTPIRLIIQMPGLWPDGLTSRPDSQFLALGDNSVGNIYTKIRATQWVTDNYSNGGQPFRMYPTILGPSDSGVTIQYIECQFQPFPVSLAP